MGNNHPTATPSSSSTKLPDELQECIYIFRDIEDTVRDIEDTVNTDELIDMIEQVLKRIKSKQRNRAANARTSSQPSKEKEEESGKWAAIIKKGSQFLEYLNKFGSSEKLHQGIKVVAETLQQAGQISSTVVGLSMIAVVLTKYEKMRDNKAECLQTLADLIVLARHLRSFKETIPVEEEKFRNAFQFIVEGSITCLCLCLSDDNKLFRFMKSSVNSEKLTSLRKRIAELYPDLVLTTTIDIRKDIPTHLPITPPVYPVRADEVQLQ